MREARWFHRPPGFVFVECGAPFTYIEYRDQKIWNRINCHVDRLDNRAAQIGP
jgi:hypothetical protein